MRDPFDAALLFMAEHSQVLIWAFWICAGALGFYVIAKQHRESADREEKQFQRMMAEAREIGAEAARKRRQDAMAYLGKEQP